MKRKQNVTEWIHLCKFKGYTKEHNPNIKAICMSMYVYKPQQRFKNAPRMRWVTALAE